MHYTGFMPLVVALFWTAGAAAEYDWYEGTQELDYGATRDYYNRHALLAWRHPGTGDWRDAQGAAQGGRSFAKVRIPDTDTPQWVEWDVTAAVQGWMQGQFVNKGFLLRNLGGGSTHDFRSREYADTAQRPRLVVTTGGGAVTLPPAADTYLESSTYQGFGNSDQLRISGTSPVLIRFDLGPLAGASVTRALLRLYDYAQYGTAESVGVFLCDQGHESADTAVRLGLAQKYNADQGLAGDPAVIFFCDFESSAWPSAWTYVSSPDPAAAMDADPANRFVPFLGKAVRSRIPAGSNAGLSLNYGFAAETGSEPEEIYWRYYHRFGDNWNPTVDGGKMPGVAGTYGVAGWGGRKSDGTNGWSARGSFSTQLTADNPLASKDNPLGWYCYHADMLDDYGDIWRWAEGYRGFLENNRWYCIEQYCKLNTITGDSGNHDGILRVWVDGRPAFAKTDIRFRHVPTLKIEEVWMNVYHGGTAVSPETMDVYFDNVVIATQYIGPSRTGSSIETAGRGGLRPPPALSALPNPFHPGALLRVSLGGRRPYRVDVYDLSGQRLRRLAVPPGAAAGAFLAWDGTGLDGAALPDGIYLLRAAGPDGEASARVVLLR